MSGNEHIRNITKREFINNEIKYIIHLQMNDNSNFDRIIF